MSISLNNGVITGLPKGSNDQKLRDVANKSGLLMLEEAFTQQLQALYDEEGKEDSAGGYYRELIPYLVEAVFKDSPECGLGKEIYEELSKKVGTA
ncbi:MAG: hypothetical protein Q8Q56_05585 [Alphaproteobacteria bacterium]|nr:hypothetical protein [Alphaproteobacteria bacterium]